MVTAPFALLGSLFAGAEDAQFVDFAPGDATLDAATSEGLAALGKSLVEKPELKLDVPIGVLADLDRPALTERAYRARARPGRLPAAVARTTAPAYDASTPERSRGAHHAPAPADGTAPVVPEPAEPPDGTSRNDAKALREAAAVEYLENAVRESVTVPEAVLDQLAEERAVAVERALLTDTGLEPTRVFKVREGKLSANEGKVRFELGLK